ncbi:hypothetical protein E2C01_043129 [Portunus trituberculatus]|uniref:Uncharacterized protein n=1 Tax=Portunus trituberculatus TaxID=210409 RepID=A0A5B7FPF4_PORTR|nr:hypothetical protein [Portunus trituberculatus]
MRTEEEEVKQEREECCAGREKKHLGVKKENGVGKAMARLSGEAPEDSPCPFDSLLYRPTTRRRRMWEGRGSAAVGEEELGGKDLVSLQGGSLLQEGIARFLILRGILLKSITLLRCYATVLLLYVREGFVERCWFTHIRNSKGGNFEIRIV